VKGYGAIITECEPTLIARETEADKIRRQTGATFLHPYDNELVIAGQGTAAKEMIEDIGYLDVVICPVGGGGLLAGTALSTRQLLPNASVVAAEPLGADDAKRSFYAGRLIPQKAPQTIADGLLTSVGERNFEIIKACVDEIITTTDESIINAMRIIWQYMKVIIEPSSAVPLAMLLEHNLDLVKGKKVGVILTGGNVDIDKLPWMK
ncbi:MAG: pyridoxal-phosphate dependent enzyme, partial [Gammaproteobacteria bacterium]